MDGRRFDDLARVMARDAGRRVLLRGIAGLGLAAAAAVARGRIASAQSQLPPGSACSSTQQCSQAGGATACADNGIASDGPLTCCRLEAAPCAADFECCGAFLCIQGACRAEAQQGAAPTPAPVSGGTLPLGAACVATAECAASVGGRVTCGDNLIAEDGPLTCCLEQGGACAEDRECCGAVNCDAGFCGGAAAVPPAAATSPAPPAPVEGPGGDLAPGEVCIAAADCSQALGPATCGMNGSGSGAAVCCLTEASPCTNDLECCDEFVCADNGITADGGLNCCGYTGAACTNDAGCCADLFCFDGICQPL